MRKGRTELFGASFFLGFRFCVFTELVLHPSAGPFGDHFVLFYVFTKLILHPTSGPFGDETLCVLRIY